MIQFVDKGHGPRPRERKEKVRGPEDIKAEIADLKCKVFSVELDIEEAESELCRVNALYEDLNEQLEEKLQELEPYLRPWDRPRDKRETKLTIYPGV